MLDELSDDDHSGGEAEAEAEVHDGRVAAGDAAQLAVAVDPGTAPARLTCLQARPSCPAHTTHHEHRMTALVSYRMPSERGITRSPTSVVLRLPCALVQDGDWQPPIE